MTGANTTCKDVQSCKEPETPRDAELPRLIGLMKLCLRGGQRPLKL